MSSDLQSFKAFLNDAREKAELLVGSEHVGADAKAVIKDLLQLTSNLEGMLQQSSGQSADARILKKKLEQSKGETKFAQTQTENLQKTILSFVEEIKLIAGEASAILKRAPAGTVSPDLDSATKIKTSAQKMAEMVVKSQQATNKAA